jgi:predicted nucleic acid-binding protein
VKAYWDSSALIATFANDELRQRLIAERGITRSHAITEVFAVLTGGNLNLRVDIETAVQMLKKRLPHLDIVDLTIDEAMEGLEQARQRGVRGGRVHDFMHALAAKKAGVAELLTADRNDFAGLVDAIKIFQI